MLRFLPLLLTLLATLFPMVASADTLNPARGNAWDLYVFGNAYVVEQVLTGVKLLMTSDSSGFTTLLLFMATLGFLVLAIGAGFDPSKNLLKMFTYIVVAWGVSYGSTQLTANVVVQDRIDYGVEYYVPGVPALVALPAVVTSQIGVTFTRFIETYFTPVGDEVLNVSAGQFNLFNRMLQESSQFTWRSPELKKSISAYVANCVVPAIAQGRLSVNDLTNSPNMVAEFEKARHVSILTQYYAPEGRTALPGVPELQGTSLTVNDARGAGVMMSCDSAMTVLREDFDEGAQAMVTAGNEAWQKAGVLTPFESAYTTMLSRASAAGGGAVAGFGRPAGFIMQQAMLNSSSAAFRQAAIQTGNNELVQAAAIAQAEQQQKSAWVAGFAVFNNMMGYVFVMLQTLIFAMTPLIIIALLVPGLGSKIFANYAQVLIWLTLWQPMLAIVNFILLMFGSSAFAESIGSAGGLNAGNKYIISERANDLVIAGQFLGTMVPLLTWGIVKGAMAFTEFISAGVGSQFATQAGAAAASGNLSMNNLSMNNTSLDKFSTQMSSAVGFQGVSVGTNAGAMNVRQDQGGVVTTRNEQALNDVRRLEASARSEQQRSEAVSSAVSTSLSQETTMTGLLSRASDTNASESVKEAATQALARSMQIQTGASYSDALAEARSLVQQTGAQTSDNLSRGVQASANAGAALGPKGALLGQALKRLGGVSVDGKLNNEVNASETAATGDSTSVNRTAGVDQSKGSRAETVGESAGNSREQAVQRGRNSSTGESMSESAAVKEALSQTKAAADSHAASMARVVSEASSMSISGEMDMARARALEAQYNALVAGIPTAGELQANRDALRAEVTSGATRIEENVNTHMGNVEQRLTANGNVGNNRPATLVTSGDVVAARQAVDAEIANRVETATAAGGRIEQNQQTALDAMARNNPITITSAGNVNQRRNSQN